MYPYLLSCIGLLLAFQVTAQTPLITDLVASETNAVANKNGVYLTYKVYANPPSKKEMEKIRATGMMTYFDIPLSAKSIRIEGDVFQTKLAYLEDNKLQWTKDLGYNETTTPTGLAVEGNGHVYTGEKQKNKRAITLYKFDSEGQELWKTTLDSLETVHRLYVDEKDQLTALVSFNYTRKVEEGTEFHWQTGFVFYTLTLDKTTGKRLSKIENQGLSYFSSLDFNCANYLSNSYPILSSHYSSYIYKGDTLVYTRNDKPTSMIMSQEELDQQNIKAVVGYEYTYVVASQKRKTGAYQLLINRWHPDDPLKKNSTLDLRPNAVIMSMFKKGLDEVVIVYYLGNNIYVAEADRYLNITHRKTSLKRSKDQVLSAIFIDQQSKLNLVYVEETKDTRAINLVTEE